MPASVPGVTVPASVPGFVVLPVSVGVVLPVSVGVTVPASVLAHVFVPGMQMRCPVVSMPRHA